jgi:chromosome segregation ATPase
MQRRVEETKTEHLRNDARGRADLRDLWSKTQFHPHAPETAKTDPRLAAAHQKLQDANAALDRKTKELFKDLPEVKAAEQARKDFDEAVKASQGLKDAEAARRAIEEKVAADEKVAAQAAKLKAAGDAQAAHRKTIEEIEKKIRDAATEAVAKDGRVKDAAKAVEEARARVGRTVEERVAAERKARQAAETAWHEKFEAVIAENPEAKALMNEMRSLEERLQQVRTQMGELRRPVTQ